MPGIGATEVLIIVAFLVILFASSRISKVASELGKGIRAFRESIKDDNHSPPQ